jgi:hypothetical protein
MGSPALHWRPAGMPFVDPGSMELLVAERRREGRGWQVPSVSIQVQPIPALSSLQGLALFPTNSRRKHSKLNSAGLLEMITGLGDQGSQVRVLSPRPLSAGRWSVGRFVQARCPPRYVRDSATSADTEGHPHLDARCLQRALSALNGNLDADWFQRRDSPPGCNGVRYARARR